MDRRRAIVTPSAPTRRASSARWPYRGREGSSTDRAAPRSAVADRDGLDPVARRHAIDLVFHRACIGIDIDRDGLGRGGDASQFSPARLTSTVIPPPAPLRGMSTMHMASNRLVS